MRSRSILITILFLAASAGHSQTFAASAYSKAKAGAGLYAKKKYDEALKSFNEAMVDDTKSPELRYNAANTYYKLGKFQEAEREYANTLNSAADKKLKQQAYYNTGNADYRMGRLEDAVNNYKKALEIDHDDKDAKYNLEFVQKEIKKREEQEKQQKDDRKDGKKGKNEKEKSGNEGKEGKSDKEKKGEKGKDLKKGDDSKGESPRQADQKSGNPSDKGSKNQGTAATRQDRVGKEEAEALIDSLREERAHIISNRRQETGKTKQVEKDW